MLAYGRGRWALSQKPKLIHALTHTQKLFQQYKDYNNVFGDFCGRNNKIKLTIKN